MSPTSGRTTFATDASDLAVEGVLELIEADEMVADVARTDLGDDLLARSDGKLELVGGAGVFIDRSERSLQKYLRIEKKCIDLLKMANV